MMISLTLEQYIRKHALCESCHTSYHSSSICKELVQVTWKTVLNEIISHLKKSEYYSFSLAAMNVVVVGLSHESG